MKNLLLGILVILLFSANVNQMTAVTEKHNDPAFIAKQEKAIEEYNLLIDELEISDFKNVYSGSYIDKDTNLVVYVTDDSSEVKKFIRETTENNDIKISKMKYSYIELQELRILVESKLDWLQSIGYSITSVSINEADNAVVLSTTNVNVKDLEKIINSEVISKDIVVRYVDDIPTKEAYPTKGGTRIYVYGVNFCSLGFPATRGSDEGFVTAGHCATTSANVYSTLDNYLVSSELFGEVVAVHETGSSDSAFVKINSNGYIDDNILPYGNTPLTKDIVGYYTSIIPTGTYVCKSGYSDGWDCGYIDNNNVTVPPWENTNLATASYTSSGGDSGGIVVKPVAYGQYQVVGVHTGRYNDKAIFSQYYEIKDDLGVVGIYAG